MIQRDDGYLGYNEPPAPEHSSRSQAIDDEYDLRSENRYHWTTAAALYQLRWEPSERRASAVRYLEERIAVSEHQSVQGIASALLTLIEESDQECPPEPPVVTEAITRRRMQALAFGSPAGNYATGYTDALDDIGIDLGCEPGDKNGAGVSADEEDTP